MARDTMLNLQQRICGSMNRLFIEKKKKCRWRKEKRNSLWTKRLKREWIQKEMKNREIERKKRNLKVLYITNEI
jgi:hypothetical protein